MKTLKYYSPFLPVLGIFVVAWFAFWSKHPKEYAVWDETNSLIVALIQFCAGAVIIIEFNLI